MTGSSVARKYARALFAVGDKAGPAELDRAREDLALLRQTVEASPDLARVFKNPIFTAKEKTGVMEQLTQRLGLGRTMHNFCLLLAERGRFELIGDIADTFGELLDAKNGVLRGTLVTAFALSEEQKGRAVTHLSQQTGHSVVLDFETAPEIIGGTVLKFGDSVLDASVRAQISMLKETIKRGE